MTSLRDRKSSGRGLDSGSVGTHDARVGGIGTERREIEFEPLPEDPVPEPATEPAPSEPEPAPA